MPTPSRTGYNFDGWYTSKTGGSSVSSSTKASKNMTVYAHWTAIIYRITFDACGGTVSPTSKHAEYGTTITPPTPTRAGYVFDGWYTSATGGSSVTSLKVTKHQTLYAHWTPVKYTISFNANGGTVSPTSITVESGNTLSALPTPTKEGYYFLGWYTSVSGGTKVTSLTVTKNQTLYAYWKVKIYPIYLDANGGTVPIESISVDHGGTISSLPTPTRSGYSFLGWYTSPYGGEEVTTSTIVTESMTIYAHWYYIPSVTYVYLYYDANGGTVSSSYKAVAEGSTAGTLLTPTRTDYTF